MLASRSRIPRRVGFTDTMRLGSRTGNRALVVYVKIAAPDDSSLELEATTQAGIVVPKREVARAVDRNRVKRRLRHLLAARLSTVPSGTRIVVRALRGCTNMTSDELAEYLDRGLRASLQKEIARG